MSALSIALTGLSPARGTSSNPPRLVDVPRTTTDMLSFSPPHPSPSTSTTVHLIPPQSVSRRRLSSTSHTPLSVSYKNSLSSSYKSVGGTTGTPPTGGSPLNTNSPVAIAAAAAVTPQKLSRLLLTQGPLAIRHITSHLALTIPGFADLSLSKQRRLIIAVLDSGDPVNSVVFEKVGWGRWAARQVDSPAEAAAAAAAATSGGPALVSSSSGKGRRRNSITSGLVNVKPPISPMLNPVDALKHGIVWNDDVDLVDDDMMFHNSKNGAVFDDSDSDESDDEELVDDAIHLHLRHSKRDGREGPGVRGRGRGGGGDTDDEDWRAIGAAKLRREEMKQEEMIKKREQEAVDALVQMRSI
jgi:hypothetical protein